MSKKQHNQSSSTNGANRNELIAQAFDEIVKDGMVALKAFEANKYRTMVTVDHRNNEKYPNLIKEGVCYFFNLTLSSNKHGDFIIYFSYDSEALTKFGRTVYNILLRSIFQRTSVAYTKLNIENCVRINITTRNIHDFYYKRVMDGVSDTVVITALDHVQS